MSTIEFVDKVTVLTKRADASDAYVVEAAKVSVDGIVDVAENKAEQYKGLINYLMKNRHGSPFEHNQFVFTVDCPIDIAREFFRHRVGFSYNEVSGRYKTLEPRFYLPNKDRPLLNSGSGAHPNLRHSSKNRLQMFSEMYKHQRTAFQEAWYAYEKQLEAGIANEVARGVLPLSLMTQFQVTCNARSLMSFLSLRTEDKAAKFISHPKLEIEWVAREMEKAFKKAMPITYAAFVTNGRVSP